MRGFVSDLRFALRVLAKHPGATVVAVLSLAVAVGPNLTLFSALDHLLLRPSAVSGADRIFGVAVRSDQGWEGLSYLDYLDYREQSKTPEAIVAYLGKGAMWTTGAQTRLVMLRLVSDNYFTAFGLNPALGRFFVPGGDERSGDQPEVVVSSSFWQRHFARDPQIIGKTMLLNGSGFTIIGVAPPGFRGTQSLIPNDLWLPFGALRALIPGEAERLARRDYRGIDMSVRLRAGMTEEQAETELSGIAARLAEAYPDTNKGRTVILQQESRTGFAVLGLIVLSLVGLVLLIACANVAGILLAQGEARRREIAVRRALGAGRGRIIRQLLAEGLLISLAAGGLGLLMTFWLVELLPTAIPPTLGFLEYDMDIDGRVLAYALLLMLVLTLAFSLVPALRTSRPELVPALRGGSTRRLSRLFSFRGALVVGQIAVAQFLLAGAGLLLRSYLEVEAIRPGFDTDKNLLLVFLVPDSTGLPASFGEVADRMRVLPGVRRVSFSKRLPLSGSGEGTREVSLPGETDSPVAVGWNSVGSEFFSVAGTRVLRGRAFDSRDSADVAVVNETLAIRLWGDSERALGRFFQLDNRDIQVIGVAEDGKYRSLRETPMPYMFLVSPSTTRGGEGTLWIETATDAGGMAATVRQALIEAAPNLTIVSASTLRQHLRYALFADQIAAGLVGIIGLLGIFLAGVGLYGVISYAVNRRAREIGVRVALGAQPGNVLAMVLRQAMCLVIVGTVIGLAVALAAARVVSAALYNVNAADPAALFGSVGVVTAIVFLAAYAPARRALRLDPMAVLRQE